MMGSLPSEELVGTGIVVYIDNTLAIVQYTTSTTVCEDASFPI